MPAAGVAEGKGDLPKMIGPDGDGGAAIVERHAGRELFAAIAWRRDLLHAPVQGEELRAGVPPGAGGIMLRPIAARCWFFGWFTTGRAPGVRCRGGSTFPRRKRHRPASYTLSTAAATPGATAVTPRTRPDAVSSFPPASSVAAWKTNTSSRPSNLSRPEISFPVS